MPKTRVYKRIIIVILTALSLGCLSGCGEKTYIEKDTPGYSFTNLDEATPSDGE
ncbi:MAG: hypothetical protein K5865_10330 [Eubacterium sp.]|nr:hypothetical protein [Eubacterium sp.]